MTSSGVEIEGKTRLGERIFARISAPERDPACDAWICTISCDYLFSSDKRIVGVSAAQAEELATMFLESLWEHEGIERQHE